MNKLRKLVQELEQSLENTDKEKDDIEWALKQFEEMPRLDGALSRALSICSSDYIRRIIRILENEDRTNKRRTTENQ